MTEGILLQIVQQNKLRARLLALGNPKIDEVLEAEGVMPAAFLAFDLIESGFITFLTDHAAELGLAPSGTFEVTESDRELWGDWTQLDTPDTRDEGQKE
jgi:hypothetical protein